MDSRTARAKEGGRQALALHGVRTSGPFRTRPCVAPDGASGSVPRHHTAGTGWILLTTVVLLSGCLLFAVSSIAEERKDNILQQRNELESIRKEVDQGKQALDSLRSEELTVHKRVSDYDQRIASNRKIISRLSKELKGVRGEIDRAQRQLTEGQRMLDSTQRRYLSGIRSFYFAARKPVSAVSDHPDEELELNRQIVYLSALADYESGNVAAASVYLSESLDQLDQLAGDKDKVISLKKKKETATALEKSKKESQEKKLHVLRRRKAEEADRISMLQQAAREMEMIVARLERERQEQRRIQPSRPAGVSAFATLRGQLAAPCRGRVVVPFGHSADPITNLKSFSPGITIKTKPKADVTTVAAGIVAYTGDLRGYGKFTIVDHGDQYYSTYAGLGETFGAKGQYFAAGAKLARAGDDGLVKLELRLGREPLDPVKWIRIDSF